MLRSRPLHILVVPPIDGEGASASFVDRLAALLPHHEVRFLSDRLVLPGESLSRARVQLLSWADVLVPHFAHSAYGVRAIAFQGPFHHLKRILEKPILDSIRKGGLKVLPVVEGKMDPDLFEDSPFQDFAPAILAQPEDWTALQKAIDRLAGLVGPVSKARMHPTDAQLGSEPALEIARLEIRNLGCFKELILQDLGPWVTVLGDNAAGKSTLLRAIALGLCAESDTTVLLKSLPGPFLRDGAKKGSIRIHLRSAGSTAKLWIETVIESGPAGEFVRKFSKPDPFPWERVFACGYGTGRSRQANSPSRDAYSALDALRALFEDRELQNPEVVLQRQENGQRRQLEDRLMGILMLDEVEASGLIYGSAGVTVRGPWGDRPFRVLSDGYRSTSQWVLDFCAWAIYAGRLDERSEIGGILLIDEIEQHLHPRWQREFVQRLRKQFPKTQIFSTTHTPLVASGVADLKKDAQLIRLKLEEDGSVEAVLIEPKSLDGMRADQVLTSEAFGLVTSRNLGSDRKIDRYTALLGQDSRTEAEVAEMAELAAELEDELRGGETEAEREVEKAVGDALKNLVTPVKPEVLEVEAKRQLRQLFSEGESEAD